jgi:hypothetical protein
MKHTKPDQKQVQAIKEKLLRLQQEATKKA